MTSAALLFVHVLTPLHAGVGQGAGDIDLPIARERSTGVPYVPGSSIKGALRAATTDAAVAKILFGPESDRADEHAGSVHISDARLLFLPVRSMRGVFAYATSPLLLRRLLRDQADVGATPLGKFVVPSVKDEDCVVASGKTVLAYQNKVHLEDLGLVARAQDFALVAGFGKQLGIDDLAERLCIVSDDVMSFLADTGTEVRARIRLHESTRSVAKGALWYEEALPAESVLVAATYTRSVTDREQNVLTTGALAMKGFGELVDKLSVLQLGGKATVGRGVCRLRRVEGAR